MDKIKGRLLSKPKTTRTPQYYCFVDVETIPQELPDGKTRHILNFGIAKFIRYRKDNHKKTTKKIVFRECTYFWNECNKFVTGKNTLIIIAHNILFDMTVLQFRTQLEARGFKCQFIFDQGMTFISKWKSNETRYMMLDNTNWFPGKLSKWGDKLGFPKLSFPGEEDNFSTWLIYCERDVDIMIKLQEWFKDFLEEYDLGGWKYTLASQSFNTYRHSFMKHNIYIPETSNETELARNAYKGGRTECFFCGEAAKQTYYKLDINSMYPYVMMDKEYPTNVEGVVNNPRLDHIDEALADYAIIAYCDINTNQNLVPVKVGGKTIYPIGKFSAYLSTPEYQTLRSYDDIVNVHSVAYYRKRMIFKDFVKFFYGKRVEYKKLGDELRQYMFKIFLNSLYGKFGQRNYEDKIIGNAYPGTHPTAYYYNHTTGERGVIRQIGSNIILSTKGGEGYNSFVAVASHVTAYARCLLYEHIKRAGHKHVLYTDTDSLIVDEIGLRNVERWIDNDKLGYLKIEGVSDYVKIIAPKQYYFGESITRKGVSAKSPHLGNNVYRQEIWPRLNKLLETTDEYYYTYFVNKHLTASVTSGIISSDGFVKPYYLTGE